MNHSNVKSILYLFVGRGLIFLNSFISVKLLILYLSKEEVGIYYLVTSIIAFISMLFFAPVLNYLNINTQKFLNEKKVLQVVFNFWLYDILIIILALPIVLLYAYYTSLAISSMQLMTLIILHFVLGSIGSYLTYVFNQKFDRIRYVIYTNGVLFFGLLLAVLFVYSIEPKAFYWILGLYIARAFITISTLYDYKKKNNDEQIILNPSLVTWSKISPVWYFSMPLLPAYLFAWMQSSSYRFIVEHYFDLKTVALVSIATAIAVNIIIGIETLLGEFLLPYLYKKAEEDKQQIAYFLKLYINSFILILIPIFLFLYINSQFMIKILANSEYENAFLFFNIALLSEFFRVLAALYSQYFLITHTTKHILRITISLLFFISLLLFTYTYNFEVKLEHIFYLFAFGSIANFIGYFIISNKKTNFSLTFDVKIILLLGILCSSVFISLFEIIESKLILCVVTLMILIITEIFIGRYLFYGKKFNVLYRI